MRLTATDAKKRFGSLCAQAKREPAFVERVGQVDTVIMSTEHYLALQSRHSMRGHAARKQASASEFAEWIAAQNAWVEAQGIPGADLRPW